jgi:hypothetical protein
MSESTLEIEQQEKRETVTERADRFKTRKVRIYESINGRSELVDTREMAFTKAMKMKCERGGGVIIEGADAWIDEHKGRLRIKQRIIEDLLSTEGFARNIIAWANYDDYVLLVAAKDFHFGWGLTIYEGEEFWFPRVLSTWAPTTKEEGIKYPNMWGTGFAAYTADGQPVEFPVRLKKVSAYPWQASR